jgi:hypothetical protein
MNPVAMTALDDVMNSKDSGAQIMKALIERGMNQ